ncbi:MAG: hypothetical protein MJZ73_00640 [Bacteroidaceae bacterium]|nr:hypothetical protein [Bacteroidaceae bacterium]
MKSIEMIRFNRQNITKVLSMGVILMGIVHVIATFTPMIADKLAMLPEGTQGAFTYFSLMCGALLVLGGGVLYSLSGKTAEYPFVRTPFLLALVISCLDGLLAVYFMPHNPFARTIFALVMGLILANAKRFQA